MNERTFRLANVASAAVVIGGILLVAMPRQGLSIIQLVMATIAAASGLHVLALNVPPTGWMSPFRWMSPFAPTRVPGRGSHGADEIDGIRRKLSGWRQPVDNGPPLPPDILRLLKPLIVEALELDPTHEEPPESAREMVSPLTWAVLTTRPLKAPHWFRTVPPREREVAEVVHRVLDDLDRVASGAGDPAQSIHPNPMGMT